MKNLLFIILFAFPCVSMAHGSKVDTVSTAISVAFGSFFEEEPKDIVKAFNAVKSWVSGSKIKVKVYYNSDTKYNAHFIYYICEVKHNNGKEEMACAKS